MKRSTVAGFCDSDGLQHLDRGALADHRMRRARRRRPCRRGRARRRSRSRRRRCRARASSRSAAGDDAVHRPSRALVVHAAIRHPALRSSTKRDEEREQRVAVAPATRCGTLRARPSPRRRATGSPPRACARARRAGTSTLSRHDLREADAPQRGSSATRSPSRRSRAGRRRGRRPCRGQQVGVRVDRLVRRPAGSGVAGDAASRRGSPSSRTRRTGPGRARRRRRAARRAGTAIVRDEERRSRSAASPPMSVAPVASGNTGS